MSSATPLSIVARIRQERLRLGWTQNDLARRAHVAPGSYGRFERTGQITLERFVAVAAALGFNLELTAAAGATAAPAPLAGPVRQRGLRHAAPAPATAAATSSAGPATPARPARRPHQPQPSASAEPTVDEAAVAAAARKHRDTIRYLVRSIVFNRLNNYTSATVVRTTMGATSLTDADKPAFVAATEAQLGALTADNCIGLGITPAEFTTWAATWRSDLGIIGATD